MTPLAPGKTFLKTVAGLILLGSLAGALIFNQSIRTKAKEGQPAPAWTVEDLSGRPVSLSDFRGQTVLLNLWTTWCISCKEETAALQAFHERYGDRVVVIGLDVREPVETVKKYMRETGITFLVLRDKTGRVPGRYNLQGYPETWFIDGDGVARAFWKGPMSFETMRALYEKTTGQAIDGAGVGPVAPGNHLHVAAPDPADPTAILAGTHQGLRRGEGTAGAGWGTVSGDLGLDREDVMALALPAERPGIIFAAGHSIGVVRSRDGGRTWQAAGGGLPAKDVHALAVDSSGRRVYAWVVGKGLHRSDDGGESWQAVGGALEPDLPVTALAVDPRDPDRLLIAAAREWAAGWDGVLLDSRDGGRAFEPLKLQEKIYTIDTRPAVFGIAFDPADPRVVYLATHKGIWQSGDGGRTAKWLRHSPTRKFESITAAPGGKLVAAAANGDIYRSRDGGASWALASE